ncbi:MAG: cytidine/deoxycytidylate deaminase family protein [Candidatus Norongarragalinales archaeon]
MPEAQHLRPSWDEYFMQIAHAAAARATCDRGKAAAVLVKDKFILSTGYVGAPMGLPHCNESGHLMKTVYDEDGHAKQHCVRTTHAEQNAIVQAARHGVSIEGATLYCKMEPCLDCAKMIINAGIKRVVAEKKYHAAALTREYFAKAGVLLEVLHDETEDYPNQ